MIFKLLFFFHKKGKLKKKNRERNYYMVSDLFIKLTSVQIKKLKIKSGVCGEKVQNIFLFS